ncbi:transposase-like protein [Spinactinospora alkalitolerans]|uniref:Mutator family transposase n=1 Tax=Spinactinospora alkalitolerans TaxID=687207 RepID=A0A852TTK9_9ACTN|nr:transposase [Spinactinospora alkalitolerans]NYE45454.1 transposase-like protein [Spinactinospora alkalitolerans]
MSDKSQIKTDTGRSDQELVAELMAKAEGIGMVGENGLLSRLATATLENVLQAEMDEHLAPALHARSEKADGNGNARDGTRSTTVATEAGPVEIEVPRDRNGSFEPHIVQRRQRRLNGVNSRRAVAGRQGAHPCETCAHLAEVYGAEV